MRKQKRFLRLNTYMWVLAFAIAVGVLGCGPNGLSGNNDSVDTSITDQTDDGQTNTSASKSYVSTGGTAGLGIGTTDTGVATLASFNPGAFVQTTAVNTESSAVDGSAGAAQDLPPPPPPDDGTVLPPPPPDGTLPPPPPPDGTMPPPPDGSMPPPPDGSMPPPPPGGFPPPPGGFIPPPIPGLLMGPPPTFPGGMPPPPPPPGFEQFPGFFNFASPEFTNFANQFIPPPGTPGAPPPPGQPGGPGGPPPPSFANFPFAQFLADHPLDSIIPGVPPRFEPGAAFGQFTFGSIPPPPPGFPPFPPPPIAGSPFGFGPPTGAPPPGGFPPGTPPPPGTFAPGFPPPPGVPIGPPPELPPGLPEEFYAFHDAMTAMHDFLAGMQFPPPPGGPLGPDGAFPGEGVDGLPPGNPFNFIDFASIAEFLPPGFLSPEAVAGAFENFGAGHPLIGEGGEINPELEAALDEHPPIPPGFDGFDFQGDLPHFDDLFTVYNAATVGQPLAGQVNSTFVGVLEDGSEARRSETTLIEAITGQATPLVQMEPGIFQTQWVVDIHQTTTSHIVLQNAELGDGTEADLTKEVFSQMTWTMLIQEVDTDGDGVADEVHTTGANQVEVLEETTDGALPEGLPPLPPPPELLLPFQFQSVLGTGKPPATPEPVPEPQ